MTKGKGQRGRIVVDFGEDDVSIRRLGEVEREWLAEVLRSWLGEGGGA